MQDRNNLISFLQVFGILLVVVGHSNYGAPETPLWHTWIYSFHMPLFMFISGFLLRYGIERKQTTLTDTPLYGNKGFIWKKVKRLLIPYVVISTLAFFPKALLSRFAARSLEISWDAYIKMLVYPWDNVIIFFWFLPTLFIIFLIVMYGARMLQKLDKPMFHGILLILLALLHVFNPLEGIMLLNLQGVVAYLFYFCLGYYGCQYHIAQRLEGKRVVPGICLSGLLSILFVTVIPPFTGKDILMALNGIALSILLGNLYVRRQWRFFHHLFGASYATYLFSWFPQVASQQILLGITHAPWQVGSLLAMVTGTYIPWLIYKWIVRHKKGRVGHWIALLTGQ